MHARSFAHDLRLYRGLDRELVAGSVGDYTIRPIFVAPRLRSVLTFDEESTRWDSSSAESCCLSRVSCFCRASTSEEERAGSEACLSWLGVCEFFIWFSELASGARVRGPVLESAAC